jgi:predicted CXXCH cytochrome family protein
VPMLTALALVLALAQPAPANKAEQTETCLACHGDRALEVKLPSGETRSLHVDLDTFTKSIHGDKLTCVDCHSDITDVPHDARPFQTKREFSLAYYENCKRCHFANYTKTLDSVHFAAVARGDRMAPLCVDCHGAHDVALPDKPRSRISTTCARCHEGVSATYAKSVHGKGLLEAHNADVPTCSDCHRSHDVGGPAAADWRAHTPQLCVGCHGDEQLMARYGLSAAVGRTYLADFHGMTAAVRRAERDANVSVVAKCTDCHGVHDITKTEDPNSPVVKANLVKTCQKCHADATANFPAAWLSHYEPTWKTAPMVRAVQLAYQIFIPFMIGGLVLQILLHLWRVVVNR